MMWRRVFCLLVLAVTAAQVCAQPGRVYKSLAEVQNPEDVYVLQLHNKKLRHIPSQVYQMVNLQTLDLRGNKIAYISDSIVRLEHLQVLDLSRNPLMDLPSALAWMKDLRELVLWSTYVNAVPQEFARLDGQLQLLDLRDCPLMLDDQKAIEQVLPTTKKKWYYACNCGD